MSQCHNVTMSQCHNVTMSQCYNVTISQCFQDCRRVLHYVFGHNESFGVKYVLARQRLGDAHFGHMVVFRIVSDGNVSNFALVCFQSVANSGRRCWKFP